MSGVCVSLDDDGCIVEPEHPEPGFVTLDDDGNVLDEGNGRVAPPLDRQRWERTAFHEAGHAVIAIALFGNKAVRRIWIGGIVKHGGMVDGRRHLLTFHHDSGRAGVRLGNACIALGGCASVRKFGGQQADPGAVKDVEQAWDAVYEYVCLLQTLPLDATSSVHRAEVHEQAKAWMTKLWNWVDGLLTRNEELVKAFADALLQHGELDEPKIAAVLEQVTPVLLNPDELAE